MAAGPATEHRWGRWQFPTLEITPHGRLLLFVHVEISYGKQRKVYVSRDHRRHRQEVAAVTQGAYGLRLPTGEWLRTETVATTPAASITLPAQFAERVSYRTLFQLYRLRETARHPAAMGALSWDRDLR